MPLVPLRLLLDHAAANNYGVAAFNVNDMEQIQAIMEAAKETGAPVILQASAGARKYAGEPFIKHLILAAIEAYPQIPLVMHQDHGQSPDVCRGAMALGANGVLVLPFNAVGWFETAPATLLELALSGATQVSGAVGWVAVS